MLSEGVWNGVGVMRWILLRVKSGEKDFFYYTWSCNVWRTAVVRLVVERPRSVILSSCHCDNLKSTDSFTTIQKYEIMYANSSVIYRSFPSARFFKVVLVSRFLYGLLSPSTTYLKC